VRANSRASPALIDGDQPLQWCHSYNRGAERRHERGEKYGNKVDRSSRKGDDG